MLDLKSKEGCCSDHHHSHHLVKAIVMIVLVLLFSIYLIFLTRNEWKEYDYIGKSSETRDTISISGEGSVVIVPDIATVRLGLESTNPDVAKAQEENTNKMNEVIKDIKGFDIEKEDIQTSSYSIYPDYKYTQDKGRVLNGYKVSQALTIRIRNFDSISDVLALAGKYNLNQVGGLEFTVDDPEEAKQEARLEALEQAQNKASDLANAADVKLGKIVSFNESSGGRNDYDSYYKMEAMSGLGGSGDIAPSVEAGSQEITVYVTVQYELL
jgi:uncharacterized protein